MKLMSYIWDNVWVVVDGTLSMKVLRTRADDLLL